MELETLIKILNGDLSYISLINSEDIALYEVKVAVLPKHVKKMLMEYLDGKRSAADLTYWAQFICKRTEYVSPAYLYDEMTDHLNDEIEDYYEDMFYVIQRLSTPEIDGEVNDNRVKSYLTELNKYP